MDEEVTPETIKRIADLKVQAMMFDMEVDWEAGKLIPKQPEYKEPFWIKKWRDKQNSSDSSVIDNGV